MEKTPRKKKKSPSPPESAQLTPLEALELRQLEFQVATAQAALQKIVAIRNVQATAIAKLYGIDISQGGYHVDTDAGRITKSQEG